MSAIRFDIFSYLMIFAVGAVIEYFLITKNIVPINIMTHVGYSWNAALVYLSMARVLRFVFGGE